MSRQLHNGWAFRFKRNVHMYSHDLRASKEGQEYVIPCENSPVSDGLIAMWPYELKLEEATYQDLLKGLLEWANTSGIKYRLYKTRDVYETNESRF